MTSDLNTEETLSSSGPSRAETAPTLPAGRVSQVRVSFHLAPGTRVRVIAQAKSAASIEYTAPAAPAEIAFQVAAESSLPPLPPLATPLPAQGTMPVESAPPGMMLAGRGAASAPVAAPPLEKATPAALPLPRALVNPWNSLVSHWAARPRAWPVSLPVTLFGLALVVYLAVRLIGLTSYPIYFFTDEAIHPVSAADLIRNGWRGPDGEPWPPYFKNGTYYNLGVSVYVQVIPYLLFSFSAYVTRATSVLFTLLAAIGIGVMLKRVFKATYWWAGVLLFSIMPAWFLHSRTAFETVLFVAFYGGMLCCYLLYRYHSPLYVYPTLLLAGLAFYSYSPGQAVVAVSGVLLLVSDFLYHWRHLLPTWSRVGGDLKRRWIYPKDRIFRLIVVAILLGLMAFPYLRQTRALHPTAPLDHLRDLGSYWMKPGPVEGKLARFADEYFYGLSPEYWYFPNSTDLERHKMDDYGNLLRGTLPFALLGLAMALRQWRSPAHRAVLAAMIATPVGAALVGIGITRVLVFVVPATLLTTLGLSALVDWLRDPLGQLTALGTPPRLGWPRILLGVALPAAGAAALFLGRFSPSGWALFSVSLMLAVSVWGLFPRLAAWLQAWPPANSLSKILSKWQAAPAVMSLALFAVLGIANFAMMRDALTNGRYWVQDYGMGGVQYGAYQIFPKVKAYLAEYPDREIIFSPNWANGTDVVAKFFLGEPLPVRMGSVEGHIIAKLPLSDNIVFVMTPDDFKKAEESGKFSEILIEKDGVVPCPNGAPCFYFARLRYIDNVDALFSAEKEARRQLQEAMLTLDGQPVKVRYSALDAGSIDLMFDGDPNGPARGMEANPLVVDLEFQSPRTLHGVSVIIGSINAEITVRLYTSADAEPVEYQFRGKGSIDAPTISGDFPTAITATRVTFEIRDVDAPEPSHTHVWEITLR